MASDSRWTGGLDGETVLLGTDVHERVIRWAMARYLRPAIDGG